MKTPQDKILQMLSCECISNFVQLINEFADEEKSDSGTQYTFTLKNLPSFKKTAIAENLKDILKREATYFTNQFAAKFNALIAYDEHKTLDFKIKKFCLDYLSNAQSETTFLSNKLKFSQNKIYATAQFCLYIIAKSFKPLNDSIHLTDFNFSLTNQSHEEFFISRIVIT